MRQSVLWLGLSGVLGAGIVGAVADDHFWLGTWSGKMADGGLVRLVVVDPAKVELTLQGREARIAEAKILGDRMVISVTGAVVPGLVKLTRQGENAATYTYSDCVGGQKTVTLSRR